VRKTERRAPNGFFHRVNGGGLEVRFCFVFLFLFFAGPGPWSVDAVWSRTKR
jgi:putative oxidoreductase